MGRPTEFIDAADLADVFVRRFERIADTARTRHGRASILVSSNVAVRPLYQALSRTTFDGDGLDFYLAQERVGAGDRREATIADVLPRNARLVAPPAIQDPFAAGSTYADLVDGRLGRRGRFDLVHLHLFDPDPYLGFDDHEAAESPRVDVRELDAGGEVVVSGRAVLEARVVWFTALGDAESEVTRARRFDRRFSTMSLDAEWWLDGESLAAWKRA